MPAEKRELTSEQIEKKALGYKKAISKVEAEDQALFAGKPTSRRLDPSLAADVDDLFNRVVKIDQVKKTIGRIWPGKKEHILTDVLPALEAEIPQQRTRERLARIDQIIASGTVSAEFAEGVKRRLLAPEGVINQALVEEEGIVVPPAEEAPEPAAAPAVTPTTEVQADQPETAEVSTTPVKVKLAERPSFAEIKAIPPVTSGTTPTYEVTFKPLYDNEPRTVKVNRYNEAKCLQMLIQVAHGIQTVPVESLVSTVFGTLSEKNRTKLNALIRGITPLAEGAGIAIVRLDKNSIEVYEIRPKTKAGAAQSEDERPEIEIDQAEVERQELEDMMMLAAGVRSRGIIKVKFQTGQVEGFSLEKEVMDICDTILRADMPERDLEGKARDEYSLVIRNRAWLRLQKLFDYADRQGDFPSLIENFEDPNVAEKVYLLLTWLNERRSIFGTALESFVLGRDTSFYPRYNVENRTITVQGGDLIWLAPETLTRDQFLAGMAPKASHIVAAKIIAEATVIPVHGEAEQEEITEIEGPEPTSTKEPGEEADWQEVLARWEAEKQAAQVAQTVVEQEEPSEQTKREEQLRNEINEILDRLVAYTRARNNVDFSFTQIVKGNFVSGFININLTEFKTVERELRRKKLVQGIHTRLGHYSYPIEAIPVFSHYTSDRNTDTLRHIAQLAKEEVTRRSAANGNGRANSH